MPLSFLLFLVLLCCSFFLPSSPLADFSSLQDMAQRRNYRSSEVMREAFEEASQNPGISLLSIARNHGVNYRSLRRRVTGEILVEASVGWTQGLSNPEEEALVEFALEMAERGLGLTRQSLKDYILYLVSHKDHRFGKKGPSDKWISAFFHRHDQLALRVPEKLSFQRRQASTPERISSFFEKLRLLKEDHEFPSHLIWNADETSLQPNMKEQKIIAQKGSSVTAVCGEGGISATMMVCVSAQGEKMPPLYIFQGEFIFNMTDISIYASNYFFWKGKKCCRQSLGRCSPRLFSIFSGFRMDDPGHFSPISKKVAILLPFLLLSSSCSNHILLTTLGLLNIFHH